MTQPITKTLIGILTALLLLPSTSLSIKGKEREGQLDLGDKSAKPRSSTRATFSSSSLTDTLISGVYEANDAVFVKLFNCEDPDDEGSFPITSRRLNIVESIPGSFSGSLNLTGITDAGPFPAVFTVSGSVTAGTNSRNLSGTMVSQTPPLTLFNGNFTGTWVTSGNSAIVTIALNGRGSLAGGQCSYTGSLPMQSVASPVVTNVQRSFGGPFFLQGFDEDNTFAASVNWNGTPGTVKFQINSGGEVSVIGNAGGASHSFNMASHFTPSFGPSVVKITPTNGEGVTGTTYQTSIYVYPYPQWLELALSTNDEALAFSTEAGEMKAAFKFGTPDRKAYLTFPKWVPYVGGDFGMRKFSFNVNGSVTSAGTGTLDGSGGVEFKALQSSFSYSGTANGNFAMNSNLGLRVTQASIGVQGAHTFSKSADLLSVIPGLSALNSLPIFRRVSQSARITGSIKPAVTFNGTWKQNDATTGLEFDSGTGQISIDLEARITSRPHPRLWMETHVAGGGNVTLGAPGPILKSGELKFEAGALIKIDQFLIFDEVTFAPKYVYKCNWTTNADPDAPPLPNCFAGDANRPSPQSGLKLDLFRKDYNRFGRYEMFGSSQPRNLKPLGTQTIENNGQTVVANVFPGADPQLVKVGASSKLMVWTRQNPDLPVMQSTDISWSYFNGNTWSEPAMVNSDTRAEISPVIAVDANGRVVSAWMRVKDQNFNDVPDTIAELPQFYKLFEIVSAVFDPQSQTWGPISVLTDDLALDTSLKLASDPSGNLLLTWQSNPSGEFNAPAAQPATIKYTFWNGTSWSAVSNIAAGLSNISEHSAAIHGDQAFVILPQDPNIEAENDGKLISYIWNGSQWSSGSTFADGDTDHLIPMAYYDGSGQPNVIWLKGSDLVKSPLVNPSSSVIRAESDSLGLRNSKLLSNTNGDLAIIWEEVSDNGPANIFARTYKKATNSWSGDLRINDEQGQSSSSKGFMKSNGDIELVYLSTQINRIIRTVTVNGDTFSIPNIPEEGQSDLKVLSYGDGSTLWDYDGDGRSDLSVRRPTDNVWYLLQGTAGYTAQQFGEAGDRITPADYDGDGKTDVAVFRPATGTWFVFASQSQTFQQFGWGANGDLPVPTDRDNDGKADLVVFRPSNNTWYTRYANGTFATTEFGVAGDKPLVGDFDADGIGDIALFRPSNNNWYIIKSSLGFFIQTWGEAGDIPVPADFDGDGATDQGVFRPSTGQWFLSRTTDGFGSQNWGQAGDIPIAADYDGDGKADVAVFRPTNGTWYIVNSSTGQLIQQFGQAGDVPTQSAYIY